MDLPELQNLLEIEPSIVDKEFQEKISKVCHELRGKEIQILDDFCKAYYSAEMLMTGKDFMQIVNDICLSIQTVYENGNIVTRYWFTRKDQL